jgi:hypothetical protein
MKKKLVKPEIQEQQSEENVIPFSEGGGGSYSNSYTAPSYSRTVYADEEIDDITF